MENTRATINDVGLPGYIDIRADGLGVSVYDADEVLKYELTDYSQHGTYIDFKVSIFR